LFKKILVILFIALIAGSVFVPALAQASETYTFVSALYGSNSGHTNFSSIGNVAVDKSGDIYVVEFMGNSIKKFSSSYSLIPFTFTSGGTPVSFNKPADIAFDSSGNIYVSDYDTVRKFSNTGSLISTIGTWTTILNPGTNNEVKNQPGSIDIDLSSNIYVAAPFENKVYKFSFSGGSYVEATSCGSSGNGNGQFAVPGGIAIYGSFVYVADSQNQRIQKFTDTGSYVSQWSISITSPNLPNQNPTDLAIDSEGNIFVSFPFADCIQKFSSSGNLLATIGTPCGSEPRSSKVGDFFLPMGLAVDSSGYLYVADTGNNRLEKFTNNGVFDSLFYGQIPATLNFNSPFNVAVDQSGNIFVIDYASNNIKKFSSAYAPIAFTFDRTFDRPSGICFDSSGNIYVSDNSAVRKFSSAGEFLTTIGTWLIPNPLYPNLGQPAQIQIKPGAVAIDSSGNVYITSPAEHRVHKYAPSGNSYTETLYWGNSETQVSDTLWLILPSSAIGEFNGPDGIAAYGDYVYVSETQNERIQKFTDDGVFVAAWPISTLSPLLPDYIPTCLATDKSGNVFVTISSSCVLKLSSLGPLLTTIGNPHAGFTTAGSAEGQFNVGMGIAVDGNGYLYVADFGNSRIQKFSPPPQTPPSSKDFFIFNSIPSPQTVGKPISISIAAEYELGHIDTSFTSTATLTCLDSEGNGVTISPSVTGSFIKGYWEGYVQIDTPGHYYLVAVASDGTVGDSLNFNVVPALESTDISGTEKNSFSPVDTVYASGNGYTGSSVNVYVVIHRSNWANGDVLMDIRGAPSSISLTGGAFNHATLWVNPSPGLYDIIADTNGNGKYDALDSKDYADITPGGPGGFFVVPEYALAGLGALAASLVAFALFRTIRAPKPVP
jgi:sugar lactone lactonase YvrE